MSEFFKCGTMAVPVGATEFSVVAALPFTPGVVNVTVRQPSVDAPLINAYIAGEANDRGFSVVLTSPVETEGYFLDWTAVSNESSPAVAGDTLAVSYDDLKRSVSHYLGWDADKLTDREESIVDDCIQSGVRRFYYPPIAEQYAPDFEWSFLRQKGVVQTTAGISSYELPDGFGRISGQLVVEGEIGPNVVVVSLADVTRMLTRGEKGRPRFAATSCEQAFGQRGQSKRIHLYPIPDRDYVLDFNCDADTGKIDPERRPFPLGGAMFSELVTESCLAVAEQNVNDEKGLHTENFNQLVSAMIAKDRKAGAQVFGRVGDPCNPRVEWGRANCGFRGRRGH